MGKNVGRKLTDEWKEKISKNNAKYWLGKKYSTERKQRMSETTKLQDFSERRCLYKLISPNKEEFIAKDGLKKFAEDHNLSRSKLVSVSTGKRKHHKGWTCYKENNY